MLGWLVDPCVVNTALKSDSLINEEIECRPEKIPSSILDENVDISLICNYFTNDGWLVVQDVVKRKIEADVWLCTMCDKDLHDGRQCIICDACLLWFLLYSFNESTKEEEMVL